MLWIESIPRHLGYLHNRTYLFRSTSLDHSCLSVPGGFGCGCSTGFLHCIRQASLEPSGWFGVNNPPSATPSTTPSPLPVRFNIIDHLSLSAGSVMPITNG
jgi:hypothetical protein